MTLYSGENPYVMHWAKHPLTGVQLTDVDVTVVITIWGLDGVVLINDAPMIYDATLTSSPSPGLAEAPQVGGWYYVWDSPVNSPGSYKARITIVELQAWEYKMIRLRQDKAPA